ncbi:hypothetical protein GGR16_004633 [Chelatococcus caeni]|uniref:Phage tail protein n=1 Tax=Chelatococcus caeni TaxID=1348468 RepID=A0A840C7L7_9HYPH|nr:phage tail sheath subtilisin-like domain-containing protein [Chelatococcus caeni]MBB4019578.1 hypothetical protein [Chelatococcus caeni]
MTTEYLHGVETIEVSDGIRPVRRVRTSVIGLVGTAPNADPILFPLNKPVAIPGNTMLAASLGAAGTLSDAMRAIYASIGAFVVVVRVNEGANASETLANVMGDPVAKTGVHALLSAQSLTGLKPKILIAPGFTSVRPATGVATIDVNEGGTGYTEAPSVVIDGDGTGASAIATVQNGAVSSVIVTSPGIGYSAPPTITFVGGGAEAAGAAATAVIGTTANPVTAALAGVADRLRAVVFVDGPNTTNQAAIAYRRDFGSDRLQVLDPGVLVFDGEEATNVSRPGAAYAAGLQAKMDNDRGFWWPFSNQVINGIVGAGRPIAANLSDRNSEHNWLNENGVTTIIRNDGFRFFGLRSCSNDPLTAFLSVRRIIDVIRDEVEASYTWALDRPFSPQLVRELVESVNAYLRLLKTEGAIVGGRCWLNPDFNPAGNLVSGKLTLDFDIEPVAPIERLTFRIHRNPDYYTDAVEEIVRALAA